MTIDHSFRGAFAASKKVLRSNYGLLLTLMTFPVFLFAIADAADEVYPSSGYLLMPVALAVGTLFAMWSCAATLQTLKSEKVSFQSLFAAFEWSRFGQALLASLLITVGTFMGFLFLVIPGIVFSLSTLFFMFVLVNERLGALEAIKRSFRLTKGHRIKFFFGMLVPVMLLLVGIAAYTTLSQHLVLPPASILLALIVLQILIWLLSPLGMLMLGHSYLQLHDAAGRKRTASSLVPSRNR